MKIIDTVKSTEKVYYAGISLSSPLFLRLGWVKNSGGDMVNSVRKVVGLVEIMDLDLSTSDFVDIYRYLLANIYDLDGEFLVQIKLLRKILACSVCTNLVSQPFSVEGCDHFACKNCVGSDKQAVYSDGCDNVNCHDWSKHEMDELVLCYVAMFKDLCKFICTTNAMRAHVNADPGSQLWLLVKEGALSDLNQYDSVEEDEDSDNPEFLLEHLNSENIDQNNLVDESQADDIVKNGVDVTADEITNESSGAAPWVVKNEDVNPVIINLTSLNDNSSPLPETIVQSQTREGQDGTESCENYSVNVVEPSSASNSSESSGTASRNFSSSILGSVVKADESAIPAKKLKVRLPKPKLQIKVRRGCRCGNAAAVPGKLTCCGQRCPCYVEAKACFDCRCKGCRNPHLPGGKKLLQGINAVIDTKTNTTVQLPTPSITPVVAATATGETVYGGLSQTQNFTQVYPVGTVTSFAGFSIPLPLLSVSQQHEALPNMIKTPPPYTVDFS